MKLSAVILAVVLSAVTANASGIAGGHAANGARHASMARRANDSDAAGKKAATTVKRKRCMARKASDAPKAAETSPAKETNNDNNGGGQKEEWKPPAEAANNNNNNNNNGGGGGGGSGKMVWRDSCGGSRPEAHPTKLSGPNGHIDFLNCGVEGGGWAPPYLSISDLAYMSLDDALKDPNSPYHACGEFIGLFNQYGGEFGIPPIMLAAFAMQESSCKSWTVGGGGEQGLMQITQEKCGGAPNGDCKTPWFNIRTAANYFSRTLNNNGGDVLRTIGQYNGWPVGMTVWSATKAKDSSCCRCQNNLDYQHQFLNGWMQNRNSYDVNNRLGKYFNLDVCP